MNQATCQHAWSNTSRMGAPVVAISVCDKCGKTAGEWDIRLWRARKRLRDFMDGRR